MPTITQIARAAGVHHSTASRALRLGAGDSHLPAATIERIRAVAHDLGWIEQPASDPDLLAILGMGHLGSVETGLIGFHQVMARLLRPRGWIPIQCRLTAGTDWFERRRHPGIRGVLLHGSVDGVWPFPWSSIGGDPGRVPPSSWPAPGATDGRTIPAVAWNWPRIPEQLDVVLADDRDGARQLGRHLAQLGHRQIAYVESADQDHLWSVAQRHAGLAETLQAAGGRVMRFAISNDLGISALLEPVKARRCTAIVCYSAKEWRMVLHPLLATGLRIPADLSLAVCDDHPVFRRQDQRITAVGVPFAGMVHEALHLLQARLREPQRSPEVVLAAEALEPRASTGPAP